MMLVKWVAGVASFGGCSATLPYGYTVRGITLWLHHSGIALRDTAITAWFHHFRMLLFPRCASEGPPMAIPREGEHAGTSCGAFEPRFLR